MEYKIIGFLLVIVAVLVVYNYNLSNRDSTVTVEFNPNELVPGFDVLCLRMGFLGKYVYCTRHKSIVDISCEACMEQEHHIYCVPPGNEQNPLPLHHGGYCLDSRVWHCPKETSIANSTNTCDCPYYYTDEACRTNVLCFWDGFGCSGLPYGVRK